MYRYNEVPKDLRVTWLEVIEPLVDTEGDRVNKMAVGVLGDLAVGSITWVGSSYIKGISYHLENNRHCTNYDPKCFKILEGLKKEEEPLSFKVRDTVLINPKSDLYYQGNYKPTIEYGRIINIKENGFPFKVSWFDKDYNFVEDNVYNSKDLIPYAEGTDTFRWKSSSGGTITNTTSKEKTPSRGHRDLIKGRSYRVYDDGQLKFYYKHDDKQSYIGIKNSFVTKGFANTSVYVYIEASAFERRYLDFVIDSKKYMTIEEYDSNLLLRGTPLEDRNALRHHRTILEQPRTFFDYVPYDKGSPNLREVRKSPTTTTGVTVVPLIEVKDY